MIADMLSNKRINQIVTELLIRGKTLNIYLVFIRQSYFVLLKSIRLSSKCYFIMEIPNKRELQQTTYNHSSYIKFKDFMNDFTSYNVLQNHVFIIYWCSSLCFRKNLLETTNHDKWW